MASSIKKSPSSHDAGSDTDDTDCEKTSSDLTSHTNQSTSTKYRG